MINLKLFVGSLIVIAGCGGLYLVVIQGHTSNSSIQRQSAAVPEMPPSQIHSASWYVKHPDILKQDELRCAGDAATMTPASCQNVASADAQLASADYATAAAAFNATAAPPNSKSKSP
ncbi:MAG: hypothetical protein POH28_11760 [Acidocella sp.]|nr:hypothetical protein [Acidocella sp.]